MIRASLSTGRQKEKLIRNIDYCPNADCSDYGKLQSDKAQANLKYQQNTP